MEIDLNEIIISGTINNVTDNNKDYIKFGLTTLKYDKRKVYASFNINRNLYEIYKDFFVLNDVMQLVIVLLDTFKRLLKYLLLA